MKARKGLVLDANILLRAVFGFELEESWKHMKVSPLSIALTCVLQRPKGTSPI